MTEVVRKVTNPVPIRNRSPEVQALSVTELFSYKPDYSHFDIQPGQVSLFLLRVRWQFWCLKKVTDTAVLTVSLAFWGVRPCGLTVTDLSKGPNACTFRVNFLDWLFLGITRRYFEMSVTNYETARCNVQKDLPSVTNTVLTDVLGAVNVKSIFLWCDAILVSRFLPCRWGQRFCVTYTYLPHHSVFCLQDWCSKSVRNLDKFHTDAMKALGHGGTAALIINFETR